jgi:hypothetical protein
MNERFDEIVRQTRLYNQSVYDNGEGGWIVQTAELKKFAELIIKECLGDHKERIATRYQGSDYDRAVAYGMEIVYYDIVDRFGVK